MSNARLMTTSATAAQPESGSNAPRNKLPAPDSVATQKRFLLGVNLCAAQQAFHAPAIGQMGQRPVGFGDKPAGHATVRAHAEIGRKLAGNCGNHEKADASYSQLVAQTKGFIQIEPNN